MLSLEDLKTRIDSIPVSGDSEDTLSQERATALDRYYGRPYGDEIKGRSQIVSRDLSETVDWVMPQIMRVFFSSGNVVEFNPVGPEDVELAEQESDYVNYVMLKENDAFIYIHDWVKDSLILRNGYIKTYWEETETNKVEDYTGLDDESVSLLFTDLEREYSDFEVVEYSLDQKGEELFYDLKIRVKSKYGCVRIEAVPVEEIKVSRNARGSLDEVSLIEHCTTKTRTELIEMGMDKEFVEALPAFEKENRPETTARDRFSESQNDSIDSSMDEISYRECCVKVDFDEDGKAELRRVVIVGNEIPEGDAWNEEIDFQYFCHTTPKRMPHRHVGESLFDELEDLALIKTILTRGLLDNTYGLSNMEYAVNERADEFMDDWLVSKPLGVKRLSGTAPVTGSYEAITKPNILGHILPAIQHIDQVKENRTGVLPHVNIDPNVLKEVREGPFREQLNQASAKVEMISRMFAEIGFKPLAKKVHALLIKHQDKPKVVKLRNRFVPVNPREWKNRTDLTVTVGLGNGNREETKETVSMIWSAQDRAGKFGLVGPKQEYASFVKLVKALGEPNPESYIITPDEQNPEFQQVMNRKPPPDPLVMVEQIKQESQKQIAQMEIQSKQQSDEMRMRHEASLEMMKTNMIEENKKNIAIMTNEVKAMIEGFKIDIGARGLGAEMGRPLNG